MTSDILKNEPLQFPGEGEFRFLSLVEYSGATIPNGCFNLFNQLVGRNVVRKDAPMRQRDFSALLGDDNHQGIPDLTQTQGRPVAVSKMARQIVTHRRREDGTR